MFDKILLRFSALLIVGMGSVACSNVEPIRSPVTTLPPMPVTQPQARVQVQPQQNTYVPPAFEEYKPQSLPQYTPPLESFESYVPEKNYEEAYTTPFSEEPPVVEEIRRPEPEVASVTRPEPMTPEPAPQVEDLSKNELDIDPFASVPDREVLAVKPGNTPARPAPAAAKKSLSAAANALLLAARAESAVGRHDAAITKVERALRIEPQSPLLWYQLADFNYKKNRYDQAISLARKSLQLSSGNRDLVAKNLDLMSKAATKEGNTRVFREVLDYKKMNP